MGKKAVVANYRSKPVAVHAVQWGKGVRHPAVRRFTRRREFGVLKNPGVTCNRCGEPDTVVEPSEWIVTDSDGKVKKT